MMAGDDSLLEGGPRPFPTTRWSLVVAAGEGKDGATNDALAQLCSAYWTPVYSFFRRHVANVEEARDITQEFFARLLDRKIAAGADPDRGRFRTYLLTAAQRFLYNEWRAAGALKRGAGRSPIPIDGVRDSVADLEPVDSLTPEKQFERQWIAALLDRVLERLRETTADFETYLPYLGSGEGGPPYAETAARLGIRETAARVQVFRLRSRYREMLRGEVAQTLDGVSDVEAELQELFAVFD